MRRCNLPGGVAEAQKYLDIPALRRLARQAPQHLKMQIYFCANPKPIDLTGASIRDGFSEMDS
jgi:hypothetical protein